MNNVFVVTRQRYWPDGENVVEIAQGGLDYYNPDALVQKYLGEFEEHVSLFDAVSVAISIAEAWKKDTTEPILIALGCTHGMSIPFEGQPAGEEAYAALRKGAIEYDRGRPRCPRCGEILGEETFTHDFTEDQFCGAECADLDYEDYMTAFREEENDDGEED